MRIDNYGNSWPMELDDVFEKALSKIKKDGKARYISHAGKISVRPFKGCDYYILTEHNHYHAREQYLVLPNPKFEE